MAAPPTNTNSPLFHSTSKDKPSILHVTFASDPTGSLGCQLVNCDKVRIKKQKRNNNWKVPFLIESIFLPLEFLPSSFSFLSPS